MLLSLLTIPVFVGVYARAQQNRKKAEARYHAFGIPRDQKGAFAGQRRHVPPILFLSGLTLLLLALARPEATLKLPRVEGTVILAFDVSGSMAADDLQPTRMDAAKAAAQKFIENQPPSIQIGVVAFSGSSFATLNPTDDREAIYSAINRLSPQTGTSLASGMITAINIIVPNAITIPDENANASTLPDPTPTPVPPGVYAPGLIILLTDGENNMEPDPFAIAQIAAQHGIRIYTIGIGSPSGADLSIDNFVVHTALDEPTLQQIAEITDGEYFNAQNEEELQQIYEGIAPRLVVKSEKTEMTSILAGISILLLMVGGGISLIWLGRVP